MCSTCQAVRDAMKDAETITKEEIDGLFREAEEMIKKCGGDNK